METVHTRWTTLLTILIIASFIIFVIMGFFIAWSLFG